MPGIKMQKQVEFYTTNKHCMLRTVCKAYMPIIDYVGRKRYQEEIDYDYRLIDNQSQP